MRSGGWLALAACALTLAACEVGPRVDLPGGGTGGVAIVVRQVSSTTPTRGQPVNLEATVTEDGEPKVSTQVTWSVSPSDPTLTFNPGTGTTDSGGISLSTLNSTTSSPSNVTVTAAAAGATGTLTLILQ
jgi:hypothetical protein